jgi:hypothetical protein
MTIMHAAVLEIITALPVKIESLHTFFLIVSIVFTNLPYFEKLNFYKKRSRLK